MSSKTGLLPERHPNKDFFIADIFENISLKDDMASMSYPLYSLSKKKDLRVIRYQKDGIVISISPSVEDGLPTIFDKDILLYCASLLMERINKGLPSGKTLRISVRDFMIVTNRSVGGRSYGLIEDALKRLHGVSITTNIETNHIKQTEGFHLIEHYHFVESSTVKDHHIALEITLSDWFYNSIVGKEVLTINRDYFRLGKPLERRFYEIARKHCGKSRQWSIGLEKLYDKVGSIGNMRMFRFYLNKIIETNHLPDYTIAINTNDVVVFSSREVEKTDSPAYAIPLGELPGIRSDTIQRGAMMVRDSGANLDYYDLREQFSLSLQDGFQPDNVDAAFIAFVKSKITNSGGKMPKNQQQLLLGV